MANKIDQIYEDYWAYTAAWTDLNGDKFLNVLRCCINFFDTHNINNYSPEFYDKLQHEVQLITGIGGASVRKGINQMVKIGFLKPYLNGYVQKPNFIYKLSQRERDTLYSQKQYIVTGIFLIL